MTSQDSGRLEAIWLKRGKLAPMDEVESARVIEGRGLEGNANQGGKRQITLLSAELWNEVVREFGEYLDPRSRRANLMVSGVDLAESRGRTLKIGDIKIQIYGETRPCELMDRNKEGLRSILEANWRGGVFGEALGSGTLSIGDSVAWVEPRNLPDDKKPVEHILAVSPFEY